MHIVLVEPEIPQNTGNIARLCAANGFKLHLVRPLGFATDDKSLKRAGLDYWNLVEVYYHDSIEEFLAAYAQLDIFYLTTKAKKSYTQVRYTSDCALVFGRESKGLPEPLLNAHYEHCIRIPMRDAARSLNLSNAVAIVSYEVLRQQDFDGLLQKGALTMF